MTELIIAGFDGSPAARHAIDRAAAEAVLRRAELQIVACYETPWHGPDASLDPDAIRAAAGTTDADLEVERLRVLADHPGLAVAARAERGAPQQVLRRLGATADLVVIGATGRTPSSPRDLGATARSLAMRGPAQLLVVPADAPGAVGRVVAGVDGSMRDLDVLDAATRMATLHDAELLVVHSAAGCAHPEARSGVVDLATRAARNHTHVAVSSHLAGVEPVRALRDEAGADGLIVVGRHRSTAVTAKLFHSSADALVRAAQSPVLIVEAVTARSA